MSHTSFRPVSLGKGVALLSLATMLGLTMAHRAHAEQAWSAWCVEELIAGSTDHQFDLILPPASARCYHGSPNSVHFNLQDGFCATWHTEYEGAGCYL